MKVTIEVVMSKTVEVPDEMFKKVKVDERDKSYYSEYNFVENDIDKIYSSMTNLYIKSDNLESLEYLTAIVDEKDKIIFEC